MQLSDCYFLGTITKMHGLKGHVLIKLDTDEPENYYKMESVMVDLNGQPIPFFISEIEPIKIDVLKVLFKDIEAGLLVGKEVYLPLDTLPKLTGNQFYYHEVIGFEVWQEDKKIGDIVKINDHAAQPYFLVITENTSEIAIPIIKDWIINVDREAKTILVDIPEGLVDL